MRKLLLLSTLAIALTACGDSPETSSGGMLDMRTEANSSGFFGGGDFDGAAARYAAPAASPAAPAPPPGDDAPVDGDALVQAGTLLAYSYSTTFELPARNVRGTMASHEAACEAAGITVCQLLSANVNESGADYVYGRLSLRAAPEWLTEFRAGLQADAREAGGRITSDNVSAEDLTRSIVDTEARLRAQSTLRERLENLLATQTDDLGDMLAAERELARVQGAIDSMTSQLEVMRRRVQMSTLDLSYTSAPVPLSGNAFAPLGRAINSFFSVFAEAAGLIISVVAFALPFVIIGVPSIWLLRRWWRARRASRATAASKA